MPCPLFHPQNNLTPDHIVSTIIYLDNFFPSILFRSFPQTFSVRKNSIIFHYCFDTMLRVEVNLFLKHVKAELSGESLRLVFPFTAGYEKFIDLLKFPDDNFPVFALSTSLFRFENKRESFDISF